MMKGWINMKTELYLLISIIIVVGMPALGKRMQKAFQEKVYGEEVEAFDGFQKNFDREA